MECKREGLSGALEQRVSRGSRWSVRTVPGSRPSSSSAVFLFFFFFSAGKLKSFFCRKICWQTVPVHCYQFTLSPSHQWTLPPRAPLPSTYCHHVGGAKKKSTCEGIDKVLLKGQQFKIKFWKTKEASLIRVCNVQYTYFPRAQYQLIPTIKIYSAWLKK